MPRFTLRRAFLLIALIIILTPIYVFTTLVGSGPLTESKTVVIPFGVHVRDIGGFLTQQGVIANAFVFRLGAKAIAYDQLKAGEYQFTAGQSMADIILMMHEGRSVVRMFTVAEGLTAAEVVALLKSTPALDGDVQMPSEGSLLPETYRYSYGDNRGTMSCAHAGGDAEDGDRAVGQERTRSAAYKPNTSRDPRFDRRKGNRQAGRAAAYRQRFYDRLRINMKLQSDPTVIYAITAGQHAMGRELGHDDLAFVSPYNTYLNAGLPPGRSAIRAALRLRPCCIRKPAIFFISSPMAAAAMCSRTI